MLDFQMYKLQIDTLGNKVMLRINSGVPVGINQKNNVIFRQIDLHQPKLMAVRTAQLEQLFPYEAAEVSLLNQMRQGADYQRWNRNRTLIRRSALNCRDCALLRIASGSIC